VLPLGDPSAGPLLAPLAEDERLTSWHLAWPDGCVSSRSSAAIDLLRALGHRRAACATARASGLLERVYGFVADHRDQLGHVTPDGPAPRRYP
jgi:predicted DCC family thiol-disulfide oxidoreductase YuxK